MSGTTRLTKQPRLELPKDSATFNAEITATLKLLTKILRNLDLLSIRDIEFIFMKQTKP